MSRPRPSLHEALCGAGVLLAATLCVSMPRAEASTSYALPFGPLTTHSWTSRTTTESPLESVHNQPELTPLDMPGTEEPTQEAAKPAAKADFAPIYVTMRRQVAVTRQVLVAPKPQSHRHRSLASRGKLPALRPHTVARTVFESRRVTYDISPQIVAQATKYHLDPYLIKAVIKVESGFNNGATSCAGAGGLMQLMPATGRSLGARNLYDPDQNIAAGALYLRTLLNHYDNNLPLAIAAYNAGPGNVGSSIPNIGETRRYVTKVMATYKAYRPKGHT
jgi:soluble lytic murein transglycosylase-like protein